MIPVPDSQREILALANDLIEQCRVSVGMRSAYCRLMNSIAETGRYDGTKALLNLLPGHLDRTASHLFSPVELKFGMDFENPYPKDIYDKASQAAKVLSRTWERHDTDLMFGQGVFDALKYGGVLLKQWAQEEGPDRTPAYYAKLVMPWQFGVYNEAETDISRQPCLCETTSMTLPEVWRRIYHLPNAKKLFERIKSHTQKGTSTSDPQSYFHQVLSTSQINTGVQGMTRPLPGGIVQLNNDPNYAIMGPQVSAPTVTVHELWVQDEEDYTTIIMVEPDIIIAPLFKKQNLLISNSRMQPYRLIQPNKVTNWFWGRSELTDLIEPQGLLSTFCDDMKRLVGLQIDKILAFSGNSGITDEVYGQMRAAGYVSLEQGSSVNDLTPKFPSELMPVIQFLIGEIHAVGGFPPVMQGQGEAGVRAGSHANTLMKTASPTLRDRALIVERDCEKCADLTATLMEAKDAKFYWTKADDPMKDVEATKFLLSELPPDWRVTVQSHSSSPIFADDNAQLIFAGKKMGTVDDEYVLDHLPFPDKEQAKVALRARQAAKAAETKMMFEKFPEMAEKVALKQVTGGRR